MIFIVKRGLSFREITKPLIGTRDKGRGKREKLNS
jgi:hypothetical protein